MTDLVVRLSSGLLEAEVVPQRGGVMSSLKVDGFSVLAKTPWASSIESDGDVAPNEEVWVSRWLGGWQLCAPNTGLGGLADGHPAFHGAASQDAWSVLQQTDKELVLGWESLDGSISISRTWAIASEDKVVTTTQLANHSSFNLPVGVAEHLILGTNFLLPLSKGLEGQLSIDSSFKLVALDYTGAPSEEFEAQQALEANWGRLSTELPAAVFGVANPTEKQIRVQIGDWEFQIAWAGLDHALIWKEFGFSQDSPWHGEVFALGIEPTNVPHGLGASKLTGPFLEGGSNLNWTTSLSFSRAGDSRGK